MSMPLARRLTVLNRYGMYARPAALIVKIIQLKGPHTAVTITKDNDTIKGTSIMGLLTLEATQGVELLVVAQGPEAREVLEELTHLFNVGFYSDEAQLAVPPAHSEFIELKDEDVPIPD